MQRDSVRVAFLPFLIFETQISLSQIIYVLAILDLKYESLFSLWSTCYPYLHKDVQKIFRPIWVSWRDVGLTVGRLLCWWLGILLFCLKQRMRSSMEAMRRRSSEIADYPEFLWHRLKKSLECRHKLLKDKNISCNLIEILNCNQRKFFLRHGKSVHFLQNFDFCNSFSHCLIYHLSYLILCHSDEKECFLLIKITYSIL